MTRKKTQPEAPKTERVDSWSNALTGLGSATDKRLGAKAQHDFMTQIQLEDLYASDDVAARIVDHIPNEMFREGYEFSCDASKEVEDQLTTVFRENGIDEKINEAMRWARLYGGAALILGITDGKRPIEPLDVHNIQKIDFIAVMDRYDFQFNLEDIETDLTKPGFGMPKTYKIREVGRNKVADKSYLAVHSSRVIRFDGVKLPKRIRIRNNYWGDSVLNRPYNALRNYNTAHDSAAVVTTDFLQTVYKFPGLANMVASNRGEGLKNRLQAIEMARSVLKAIVLQNDDSFDRHSPNLTGFADLISKAENRLVAASGMPHTLVLGQSPSGLGATGNSEKIDFYDQVAHLQETQLKPLLLKLARLFLQSKGGPTLGKIKNVDVNFRPLWQQSEDEVTDNRLKQAQSDQIYMDAGVLDSSEVRTSRFGGMRYSHETTIDARTQIPGYDHDPSARARQPAQLPAGS